MWEQGGSSQTHECPNDAFITFHTFANEIHVLLVDHDKECLISTARLLESCSYRVTVVELASTALLMLQKGKERFDLIMANVHSPDMHGFQLLEEAVNMELPVILMTSDEDAGLAKRALERGAFLFIQKPVTAEILVYLWQHVLREQMRRVRERDILLGADIINMNTKSDEYHRGRRHADEEEEEEDDGIGNKTNTPRRRSRRRRARAQRGSYDDREESDPSSNNNDNRVKRKVCTEWTMELHAKFMDAVRQLGEGRCYPKEILELMKVPGLTRMQVASHLQKCRNDNWRAPEERRNNSPGGNQAPGHQSRNMGRRFGSMPGNAANYHHQRRPMENNQDHHFRAPPDQIIYKSSSSTSTNKNSFLKAGETSSEQAVVYRPQLHIDPQQYYNNPPIPGGMGQLRHRGTSNTSILSINIARDDGVVQNNDQMSIGVAGNNNNLGSRTGTDNANHHHYEPGIISELTIATPGTESHVTTCTRKQQSSDEFFDFQDMDYLITNFNEVRQAGPTSISHNMTSSNPHLLNPEQPNCSTQNFMGSNTEDTKGEWS